MVLTIIALVIKTFQPTNWMKLQVWQILICSNQAFRDDQMAKITLI